ncbi:MAG: response regulator [Spirochaetales bacterium]|nr:response regulator [Spirochaetales bacterium]
MNQSTPLNEALFENGVYPLIIIDFIEKRIVRVNTVFREWFRSDEPEFRSISFSGGIESLLSRLEKRETFRDLELSIMHGNGKRVRCLGTAHRIRENRRERVLIIVHESLETSQQTEALKSRSFNLFTLSENIDMAFWSVDKQMALVDYNDSFSRLLESSDKPVNPPLPDIMGVDWKDRYERALRGEKREYSDFYRGKNLITQVSPIFTDYGEVAGACCTIRDISDEINQRKKLEVLHQRFNSILDSATDAAIIATDPQGIIRQFNRGASDMLGYSPEEIIGKRDLLHFYAPSFMREVKNYIKAEKGVKLKSTEVFSWLTGHPDFINNMEWRFLNKQRRTIDVKISISTVLMEDQSYAGILLIAQDISELKKVREELEVAKMQAEEISRTKTAFLANMSHEIRTPLNGIIGMADLLKSTDLNDMQQNQVSIVLKSANTLLLLINDILDYTRIEAGKFKLGFSSFSLRTLLDDIGELLAVSFREKNIELKVAIDRAVRDRLVGDPRRIKQILLNLVGNALKFTNEGFIEVRIKQLHETMDKLTLYFMVTDTGIGISDEEKKKLFQAFSQADASTTRRFGGSGLGLAISKELVFMMNGEIGLESSPGKGSRFWFTITLSRDIRELENRNIVIINNNAISRKVLIKGLKNLQIQAIEGSSFDDISGADLNHSDFILIHEDLIDRDWKRPNRQIMIIETTYKQGKKPDCKNIDGRLLLPCRQPELIECLTAVIEKRKKAVIFDQSKKEIRPEERIENSRARILVAEDNKINQLVAMNFLKKLGYTADLAENGEEVLQACRKIRYDAILMDQMMPVMDGIEATERIRKGESGEANRKVKIIALTANAMKGDREALLNAGMDDYIAKPIVLKDIQEILDRNLKGNN